MAESRRQWELEQSRATCPITSIQAATILGRIYFTNGMDSLGWTVWAQALAMAEKLDLFAPAGASCSEKDRITRTITAWGLFSQETYDDCPQLSP